MPWRATIVTSAVILAAGLVGAGRADAATGWQVTVLPLPDGWRGGWAVGTDGKGEYSGTYFDGDDGLSKVVIWRGGRPTVVNAPAGCTGAESRDENASRVILVEASGCGENADWTAYTYGGGAYHELARPNGYPDAFPTAINQRGDVLGQVGPHAETEATVVWPAGAEPVVIPDTIAGQTPADIDDDGTVLFNTDSGPYLWRDGTMTKVPLPTGRKATAGAIRGGVIVGSIAWEIAEDDTNAYWWHAPFEQGQVLPGGKRAFDINASGLAVGELMTWQNGGPNGSLPIPPGYDSDSHNAVGDDGSVIGSVGLQSTDRPFDQPAVWHLV
jgi:hypothetical protein